MKDEMNLGIRTLVANGAILGVVTLAEFEMILKIILLLLTIGYTCFQFWKAATKREKPE